jgi:hypothetical protein
MPNLMLQLQHQIRPFLFVTPILSVYRVLYSGMFETVPHLPEHAFGVIAHGKITAEDYESVLIPKVEKATASSSENQPAHAVG